MDATQKTLLLFYLATKRDYLRLSAVSMDRIDHNPVVNQLVEQLLSAFFALHEDQHWGADPLPDQVTNRYQFSLLRANKLQLLIHRVSGCISATRNSYGLKWSIQKMFLKMPKGYQIIQQDWAISFCKL